MISGGRETFTRAHTHTRTFTYLNEDLSETSIVLHLAKYVFSSPNPFLHFTIFIQAFFNVFIEPVSSWGQLSVGDFKFYYTDTHTHTKQIKKHYRLILT